MLLVEFQCPRSACPCPASSALHGWWLSSGDGEGQWGCCLGLVLRIGVLASWNSLLHLTPSEGSLGFSRCLSKQKDVRYGLLGCSWGVGQLGCFISCDMGSLGEEVTYRGDAVFSAAQNSLPLLAGTSVHSHAHFHGTSSWTIPATSGLMQVPAGRDASSQEFGQLSLP